MKIKDQLAQLKQDATAWTKANPGSVAVASDLSDVLTQLRLQTAAGMVAVSILFYGEKKRGEYEESGMVDRTFWIAMTVSKGMKADASARLTDGAAGAKPLYELAEDFRDNVIRAASFNAETTEVTPDYKGMDPLVVDGQTLTDTLKLEFSIGVQLPAIQSQ